MLHSCYCPMVAVALSNSLLSIVNNRSLVPQCLSASCGALVLACSQQPLIGCRLLLLWCCLLTSANNRSLVPQCLSASCGALALAANSRSLAVGCCLSGVVLLLLAATGKAFAANSRSLVVGCCCCCLSGVALLWLAANSRSLVVGCCCCLSGVALLWLAATGLLSLPFPSLTTAHWCASMSLCLMWCSCSCLQPTAAHWL